MGVLRLVLVLLIAVLPCVPASCFAVDQTPHAGADASLGNPRVVREGRRLRRLWSEGRALEAKQQYLAAATVYEEIARLRPHDARAFWHVAESYWNHAQSLPAGAGEERGRYIHLTEEWADRGLAVDADCGECYLYKVAGVGGRLQREGKLRAARSAQDIARWLERGIAILAARPDHATNPELEELYYAAAQFYRTMPESRWLKLLLGVSGSRRRALEYIRKANGIAEAIDGERPSYLVELGAAQLCVGREENDEALVTAGAETLTRLTSSDSLREKDPLSVRLAGVLLRGPERACDYSRDAWANE